MSVLRALALSLLLPTVALAATPKDTAVIALQIDDLITMDPGECYELTGLEILSNVYDRLIRYEAEDLTKMVGGVAESWTISDDHKTFTFKLRANQTFHDGAPLTAEDVAFSLQRVVVLNKTPGFLLTQLGWTKDNAEATIRATDASTLTLTVPNDFAPTLVLNLLSSGVGAVVEKKLAMAHEANGDFGNAWLKAHDAGSGPFKLLSWKPNESVSLEAFPAYRLGAPTIRRVVVRHVPEPATQRLLLEKGDIDIARNLSPDQVAALHDNHDVRIEAFPGSDTWYIGLNQSDEHLKNPKVRQALRYLVDYQGMGDSFLKGQAFVHQTFLPDGFFGALDYNPFKLDVAKAKALLAEAGYPDGFSIKLDAFNTSPWTEIAQSIQQTFAQGGIKLDIVSEEKKQLYTVFRGRKHQMALLAWGPDYLDPHTNADGFVANKDDSDSSTHKLLAWRNHWLIPEMTALTEAAAKEGDAGKREAEYHELQKSSTDDGAFLFLFQPATQVAERVGVTGYVNGITSDLIYYRKIAK